MKIKLTKALKLKNRIVAKMQRTRELIQNENRYIDEFDFVVKDLMEEDEALVNKLIELKTKITLANKPIQENIFRLSELKAWLNTLKQVSVKSGSQKEGYSGEVTLWKVQMMAHEKEEQMNIIQSKIDAEQDILDQFNATHSIDVSFDVEKID